LGKDEALQDARMAFERLYVSALVRKDGQPDWERALANLSGQRLARRAWQDGQSLTPRNFLQGGAVNGPFGVISRLARATGIIDAEEDGPGRKEFDELVSAWEHDRKLPGFLDPQRGGDGRRLFRRWCDAAAGGAQRGAGALWPGDKSSIWEELRDHLRPDDIGPEERKVLRRLLTLNPVRRRIMALLYQNRSRCREVSEEADGNRGVREERVLREVLLGALTRDPGDLVLATAIEAALAFEESAGVLHAAFFALVWSLVNIGGAGSREEVTEKPGARFWASVVRRAGKAAGRIATADEALDVQPELNGKDLRGPMQSVRDALVRCAQSPADVVDAVVERHVAVQTEKSKPPWIDFGGQWILGRGIELEDESPPRFDSGLLHPYRISNAIAFLDEVRGLGGAHGQG
jgi:hypothetical protein